MGTSSLMRARHNPFAVARLHALGFLLPEAGWHDLHKRLVRLNRTAAIVGPCGSGKTTLLCELERQFGQAGIPTQNIFISRDVRPPWRTIRDAAVSLQTGGILLVDGMDHLSRLRQWHLKQLARRRQIGLLVTSHREGILPTVYRCRPDIELLREVAYRLLEPCGTVDPERLEHLYAAHSGNLRECLRQMYDECAAGSSAYSLSDNSTAL